MTTRRALLTGAAAVAVAPTAATALPARVIEKAKPLLHFVPCDGRELRICDYPELFRVIRDAYGSWSATTLTFCVPDSRALAEQHPVLAEGVVVLEDVISTGHDPRVPAGVILLMEKRDV